jgi:hypothetical protein
MGTPAVIRDRAIGALHAAAVATRQLKRNQPIGTQKGPDYPSFSVGIASVSATDEQHGWPPVRAGIAGATRLGSRMPRSRQASLRACAILLDL